MCNTLPLPICHIRNKIGLSRTFLSSSHTSGNHHPARGAKNRAKIAFGAEKPSQKQKMRQKLHDEGTEARLARFSPGLYTRDPSPVRNGRIEFIREALCRG